MREDFELQGKRCHTYQVGDGGPVVFWGTMSHGEDPVMAMMDLIESKEDEMEPFTLFAFEVSDWNSDFSPWSFDAGQCGVFGDGGKDTLRWLQEAAIPYAKEKFPHCTELALTGYSLAGLFSLWAFYESQLFRACGCCSGSLWFEGWDRYADSARGPENGAVYLSLGGKEPGSGNVLTSSIGTQYFKQKKRIEKDPNLRSYEYVMNSGGHFSDPVGRVMRSIEWIVEELSVY